MSVKFAFWIYWPLAAGHFGCHGCHGEFEAHGLSLVSDIKPYAKII